MENSFQSKSDFGPNSVMFNSTALGLNQSKTNQLVILRCVLNGSGFPRAFVLSYDPGGKTRLVRSDLAQISYLSIGEVVYFTSLLNTREITEKCAICRDSPCNSFITRDSVHLRYILHKRFWP